MNEARRLDTLIELLETRQLLSETPIFQLPMRPFDGRTEHALHPFALQLQSMNAVVISPGSGMLINTFVAGGPVSGSIRLTVGGAVMFSSWPRQAGLANIAFEFIRNDAAAAAGTPASAKAAGAAAAMSREGADTQPPGSGAEMRRPSAVKQADPARPEDVPAVDVVVRPADAGRQQSVSVPPAPAARAISLGRGASSPSARRSPADAIEHFDPFVQLQSSDETAGATGTAAAAMIAMPLTFRKQAAEKLAEAVRVSREGIQAVERVVMKPASPMSPSASPLSNPSFNDGVSFGRHMPREISALGAGPMALVRSVRKKGLWMIAALIGMWLIFAGTTRGIGTFGDSVTYYTAAKSLLAGQGWTQFAADGSPIPLSQFPPAYPTILAAGTWITGDLLTSARWINILAAGVSILLAGFITYRLTRSAFVSGVVAMLLACHGQVIGIQVRMYSEPMYIALTLAVMASLLNHGPRGRWLVLAGFLAGIAGLTRFAGVHLIACCALWILLLSWPGGWRKRVVRAALFLAPALGLMGIWSLRNIMLSGRASSRILEFHPPRLDQVSSIFQVMKHWVIPIDGFLQTPAMIVALVLWAAVPLLALWKFGVPRSGVRARLMLPLFFVVTYLPFLLTARTFFDEAIPFNYRLLIPMFPLSLIVACTWLTRRWVQWRRSTAMPVGGVAGVISMVLALVMTRQVTVAAQTVHRNAHAGLGYTSEAWQDSKAIATLRALPQDAIIYTNAADAVYLLTGRTVRMLPRAPSPHDGSSRMKREMKSLHKAMSRERAIVVYFKAIRRDALLISEKQFLDRITDAHCSQFPDANLYSMRRRTKP